MQNVGTRHAVSEDSALYTFEIQQTDTACRVPSMLYSK